MVDYARAFKRPFADIKTLVIGIVISMIPIVNFMAFGYFLKIIQKTLKKDYGLPEWGDWGGLFVNGLMVFIGAVIYMVPALVVMGIGAGSAFAAIMDPSALGAALAGAGIFMLIALLLAIVAMCLFPAALINYAKSGSFGDFFKFGDLIKVVATGKYAITWVVMMVATLVVSGVLMFIPFIGMGISTFVMGVAMYTAITEACMG